MPSSVALVMRESIILILNQILLMMIFQPVNFSNLLFAPFAKPCSFLITMMLCIKCEINQSLHKLMPLSIKLINAKKLCYVFNTLPSLTLELRENRTETTSLPL